ncbi:LacI family DNA-binding transcriptional regulator [Lentzea jiangxiensis]|uniref:LacI family transcriptional regulator n=1 Tax=Lentzea jiangxiensis TaxID=641025 RepID=A0A1H0ITM0_9PSEU|nr:LacI family DNA-binding transcriptional regulator [Lentzea jiangxiensis]SDO34806.1 LacI family transcriptional regulator [Lentzea jiangxiensis]
MGRSRVTLADVAAASGVSVTTASLVLTGRARELRISEAAEQRVRSTARELGYRRGSPEASRPGLSRTIGFVLDAVESPGSTGDLVKGALEAAHRLGFMLLVAESGGDPARGRSLVEAMHDRRADGVVFAAVRSGAVAEAHGLRYGPAVLLGATAPRSGLPAVVADEAQGGRSAARRLLEAGRARGIHLIGADPGARDVPGRLTGLREVFEASGAEVVSALDCPERTPECGYAATAELVRHRRPQALVCLDDRLAFGAYQALADAGLSVPGDVSVLGFGDLPAASWMRPRLTTIATPHHELGERAVEVLVELVQRRGRVGRTPLVHRVPMRVREGGSVARATG